MFIFLQLKCVDEVKKLIKLLYKIQALRNKKKQQQSKNDIEEDQLDQPNQSDIEFIFRKACRAVKGVKDVSTELQLILYGLFKQAKFGDNKQEDTSEMDYIDLEKHRAWQKYKGMSKEEACEAYVQIVKKLDEQFKQYVENENQAIEDEDEEEDDENYGGGTFGLAPSKMTAEEEYENDELENQERLDQDQLQIFEFIENQDLESLQRLNDSEFNFEMRNEQGISILHSAVDQCAGEIVKFLLEKCKKLNINVNIKDIEGQTPLHYGILIEDDEIIQLLLENGADPNIQDNNNLTPLNNANTIQKQVINEFLANNQ